MNENHCAAFTGKCFCVKLKTFCRLLGFYLSMYGWFNGAAASTVATQQEGLAVWCLHVRPCATMTFSHVQVHKSKSKSSTGVNVSMNARFIVQDFLSIQIVLLLKTEDVVEFFFL